MLKRVVALSAVLGIATLSAVLAMSITSGAAPAVNPLTPGTSWNWQISSTPSDADIAIVGNLANPKKMLDIDMENNTAATIAKIHAKGIYVVCYLETGSWENYRSDAGSYPASILGNTLDGYPNERYVNIEAPELRPILQARLDRAAAKGCDGIEPDLDDTYNGGNNGNSGFPITKADNIAFNNWFADEGHARGMSVGLKNGPDQALVAGVLGHIDWVLSEQCNQYSECGPYDQVVAANKAVFNAEYSGGTSFCAYDNAHNIDGLAKNPSLNVTPRTACRNDAVGPTPTTTTSTNASTTIVAPSTSTTTIVAPSTTVAASTTTAAATTTTAGPTTTLGDTTKPSAPTNVRRSIVLSWNPSSSADTVSYAVLDNGTQIANVAATTITLTPAAGSHSYQVQAIDGAGNRSAKTVPVRVTL